MNAAYIVYKYSVSASEQSPCIRIIKGKIVLERVLLRGLEFELRIMTTIIKNYNQQQRSENEFKDFPFLKRKVLPTSENVLQKQVTLYLH